MGTRAGGFGSWWPGQVGAGASRSCSSELENIAAAGGREVKKAATAGAELRQDPTAPRWGDGEWAAAGADARWKKARGRKEKKNSARAT